MDPSGTDKLEHLGDALLAEFDLLFGLAAFALSTGHRTAVDDDAGHTHRTVLVLELREVRDVVGLGTHQRIQGGDALGGQHGLRAHRASQRHEDHDVGRLLDLCHAGLEVVAERLAGAGRVVEAQHERVELMAGRHTVEGEAGEGQAIRGFRIGDAQAHGRAGQRQYAGRVERGASGVVQ